MDIHNLMEDKVKFTVNDFCETSSFDSDKYCGCPQCRLDVVCYVLNNLPPKYVVSSRGIVHHEIDYSKKLQQDVDVFRLVKDGFNIITERKRPEADHTRKAGEKHKHGFYYNFPNIVGKIIDGKTFEPVSDAEARLLLDGSLVNMTSEMTQNPVRITKHTNGIFIFWPYPVEAEKENDKKTFTYKLRVNHPDYEEYIKLIDLTVSSSDTFQDSIHLQNKVNLEEIYLFSKLE